MKIEPGIYPGVSFEDYAKWEAVNNSVLQILNKKSALHAKAKPKENENENRITQTEN